jgi:hypothetical protein
MPEPEPDESDDEPSDGVADDPSSGDTGVAAPAAPDPFVEVDVELE